VAFGIVVYGKHPYGRVERLDGTSVLTTFHYVWFLPLVPAGSYVLGGRDGSRAGAIPIGYHPGSILAGYIRTWAPVLLVCTLLAMAAGADEFVVERVPTWTEAVFLAGVLLCGWLVLGRLSRTVAAQRRVYAKFASLPVDVSRFSKAQAADLREALAAVLSSEGRALVATYRDGPDPCDAWREVALDPVVQHRPYLEAALTRARLESGAAPRGERRAMTEAHARIWGKLEALPDVG
jgi:hypothetical protein